MAIQNRLAVLVNSAFFEREVRRVYRSRVDYNRLLKFLSDDSETNMFNKEGTFHDIVRAAYFYAETKFINNEFVDIDTDGRRRFLSALRQMGYEANSAFNSIDAKLITTGMQIASSGSVDTILLLGATIDHVDFIWDLKSHGMRVISFVCDPMKLSERLKQALNQYYRLSPELGFLNEQTDLPPEDDRDNIESVPPVEAATPV